LTEEHSDWHIINVLLSS